MGSAPLGTSKIPARVQPTAYYIFACISLSCVTKCHELTQDIAMCGLRFVNGSQQKATLFVDKNLLLTSRFPFRLDAFFLASGDINLSTILRESSRARHAVGHGAAQCMMPYAHVYVSAPVRLKLYHSQLCILW